MIKPPTLRYTSPLVRHHCYPHCTINIILCNFTYKFGIVVNWIESKALFANEISHKSYYNRYMKQILYV